MKQDIDNLKMCTHTMIQIVFYSCEKLALLKAKMYPSKLKPIRAARRYSTKYCHPRFSLDWAPSAEVWDLSLWLLWILLWTRHPVCAVNRQIDHNNLRNSCAEIFVKHLWHEPWRTCAPCSWLSNAHDKKLFLFRCFRRDWLKWKKIPGMFTLLEALQLCDCDWKCWQRITLRKHVFWY